MSQTLNQTLTAICEKELDKADSFSDCLHNMVEHALGSILAGSREDIINTVTVKLQNKSFSHEDHTILYGLQLMPVFHLLGIAISQLGETSMVHDDKLDKLRLWMKEDREKLDKLSKNVDKLIELFDTVACK